MILGPLWSDEPVNILSKSRGNQTSLFSSDLLHKTICQITVSKVGSGLQEGTLFDPWPFEDADEGDKDDEEEDDDDDEDEEDDDDEGEEEEGH